MYCCAGCFGDRFLRDEIARSKETGQCSYCKSTDVPVLPPTQLADLFDLLIGAYQADPGGKLLVQLFREDWGMFDRPEMDDSRAMALLVGILGERETLRQTFLPAKAEPLKEWEKLRDELLTHNRFFPEETIDLPRLEQLLQFLEPNAVEVSDLWYRARIQIKETPFPVEEMGAPPKESASPGRANPAGIPYLYLASTQDTAISEVRPHTGEIVSVADFTTRQALRLVDLRSPKKTVSPFEIDEADIRKMRSELPFLERLADELTMPVLPQAAAIDYTPSQYLCEFIKKCKYDGVIYRSSVSDGINLALFDPALAEVGNVTQYRVSRVSVEAAPI